MSWSAALTENTDGATGNNGRKGAGLDEAHEAAARSQGGNHVGWELELRLGGVSLRLVVSRQGLDSP